MLFNWFKKRRRQRLLAQGFPSEWNAFIRNNVWHVSHLSSPQQRRLRQQVQLFVAEKNWEGCKGLKINDEIRVTIAAQACLLTVGQDHGNVFDNVKSILVYPSQYVAPETTVTPAGVHVEGGQRRLGEAWYRGPVIVSWEHALAGGRLEGSGQNLVLHEFAHQLDMQGGGMTDGTPPMPSRSLEQRWKLVLQAEFDRLRESCRLGIESPIDCYGATNEAEFFSVLTESFFERGRELRLHSAEAYALLCEFYGIDPANWDVGWEQSAELSAASSRHLRPHPCKQLHAHAPI